MKKLYYFLTLLVTLCLAGAANAQETVEIGDAEATTNNYYTPIGTYYNYSITEQLYTAEEIGMAGTISSISFNYAGTAAKDLTITVYMMNVEAEDLSTGISLADAEIVFEGTLSVTGAGWATITLDNDFTYDGVSNLLIGFKKDAPSWYSGGKWYYTEAANMARYSQQDGSTPYTTSTVPATATNQRPNIQIEITPAGGQTCQKPDALTANGEPTDSEFSFTIEGGSGVYNIELKAGSGDWTSYATDYNQTDVNLTGLEGNTAYQVRVQSVCDGDATSGWKSLSFTTQNPCAAPTNLLISDITTGSATLSWTAGYQETSWTVRYKKSTDSWDGVIVETVSGTPTITLQNLDGLTTYNVQVCNCTGESDPYLSGDFTTAAGIPLIETFDASSKPAGWTWYTGLLSNVMSGTALTSTTYGWAFGTGNGVFDSHVRVNIYGSSCNRWLVLPTLLMEDNVQLTFDMALTKYSGNLQAIDNTLGEDDRFIVLITADGGTTWEILREWNNTGSEYVYNDIVCTATGQAVAIDLSDYAGQNIAVAFYGESTVDETGSDNYLHIDNVSIDYIPSCAKPTGLAKSNVTAHEATITWTSDATAWQVQLDEEAPIDVTEAIYTFENLDPETAYTAKVRANCSGTYSEWTTAVSFTTTIACPAPTALTVTPNVQTATFTWESNASAWEVAYATDAAADPAENIAGTVNEATYTVNDLELGDHYFWVRANCGEIDGDSQWAGPASVHIGYCVPAPTSVDNNGISNVTFGMGDYIVNNETPKATYTDYTSQIGAVQAGVETTIAITFKTGYTYNTYVWVDLDNSLSFDADEVICYGESGTSNPTTLTLNFTIPADQTTGDFRLRIGSADSGLGSDPNNANPCYSSSYGCFQDYTLRVLEAPSCLIPTDLAINYTGGTEASISWISDAEAWNMRVNGVDVNGTITNPYTLTGLELATTYSVKVQADCGDNGTSEWSNPVSFTTDLCMPENMCEISYSFTDQYDDSWNGAYMNIVDATTQEVLYELTMPNVDGPYEGSFNVCDGRDIQFVWVSGNYPRECGYIFTHNGVTILEKATNTTAPSAGVVHSYTVDCSTSACQTPTGLAVNYEGGNEATITWTSNATAWQVQLNEEDPIDVTEATYTFEELNLETTYTAKVRSDCGGTYSEWNAVSFTTAITCPAPTDLEVTNLAPTTATLNWTSDAGNYYVRYRTAAYADEDDDPILFEDFEDGLPAGWTSIDSDGDGNSWVVSTDVGNFSCHSGEVCLISASYLNGSAINPDNWLITSQIELQGMLKVWLRGQDNSDNAEHFAIYLSTSGTNVSDFTTVLIPESITTGEYQEFTANLSAYTGQQGYIAIRHFNCTDQFWLDVDDFGIYPLQEAGQWLPNATGANTTDNSLGITGLTPETDYEWQVMADCGTDGESNWSTMGTFTTPSSCIPPTGLGAEVTGNAAELSWIDGADAYNLQYREVDPTELVTIILTAGDVWEDGSGYQMLLDADATAYASNNPDISDYSIFEYLIPTDAEYDYNTSAFVFENSVSIQIPAGTYDWFITNPSSDYSTVYIAANNGNVGGRQDNYVFEAGKTYEFVPSMYGSNDGVDVTITATWTPVSGTVTSPYTLTDLNPETTYEFQVQGVNSDCEGGVTGWSASEFFTTGETIGCTAITITETEPYTQDFENPVVTSAYNSTEGLEVPECWVNPYATSSNAYCKPHIISDGASYNYAENGQVLYFYGSGYDYVTLPEFTNPLNELQITFKWATEGSSSGTLTLGYITDEDEDYSTFTAIETYPASLSSQQTLIQADPVFLNNLPAEATRLVFRWYYSSWYGSNIDDIEVSLIPPCLPVTGISTTDLSSSSATLVWANPNPVVEGETSYIICYGETATFDLDDANTYETATSTTASATISVSPNTDYTVAVRVVCTSTDEADWVTSSFSTPCEAITITETEPYTQDFENPVVTTTYSEVGIMPECWERYPENNASAKLLSAGVNYNYAESGQVLYFYGNGNNYATLPEFTNPLNELQISFKWATESSSNGTLTLGYITDEDENYNTFTAIGESYAASSTSQHTLLQVDPINLSALPANATRLVFRWYCSSQWGLNIDDVEVSLIPSCLPVTDITTTELSASSATLTWTNPNPVVEGETSYIIRYGETATFDLDDATTYETATSTTASATINVSPNTDYTVAVMVVCTSTDEAEWRTYNFSTPCEAITTFPYIEDFESATFPPDCWDKIGDGTYSWTLSSSYFHSGSDCAYSTYYGDVYLITPAITLPSDEVKQLKFWSYNTWPGDFAEGNNSVLISTNGKTAADFTTTLWTAESVVQEWVADSVSLETYAGQTIYIAFKYAGYNDNGWYLDDVSIDVIPEVATYTITITQTTGGEVSAQVGDEDPFTTTHESIEGAEVQLFNTPVEGYLFDHYVVTDDNGEVPLINDNSFLMPASDVAVSAVFTQMETVATPDISPDGGTFDSENIPTVTITCETAGATIYYTTDGYDPDESSNVYGGPITITGTTTIKAIAVAENMLNSATAEATFTINQVYYVNVVEATNGNIGATPLQGIEGTEITLLYTAEDGYHLGQWTVVDADDNSVSVNNNTFLMPASDVTVSATFEIDILTITATVNPTGAGTVEGAGDYEYGTEITLTATPAEGYLFSNWTLDGAEVSTENNFTFTVYEDAEYVANFTEMGRVATPTINPDGGTFNSENIPTVTIACTTAGATIYYTTNGSTPVVNSEQTHVYGGPITITGNTIIKAIAVAENMLNSETAVATFTVNQVYNVVINGSIANGTVSADTLKGIEGDVITLTATPSEGYIFKTWEVLDVEEMPVDVTADNTFNMPASDVTVSAQFDPDTFNVTFVTNGGILTGEYITRYYYGEAPALPTSDEIEYTGHTFQGWYDNSDLEGDPFTAVPANAIGDVTYYAKWTTDVFTVTTAVSPAGAGEITGLTESGEYEYGTDATLTAVPAQGYDFVGWSVNNAEEVTTTDNPYTFTVTEEIYLEARFVEHLYKITVTQPAAGGTVSAQIGMTDPFTTVGYSSGNNYIVLSNTPAEGYLFDHYEVTKDQSGDAIELGEDNDFYMPYADITVTAVFTAMGTVATPVIEPNGGTYDSENIPEITISCTTGSATIYYTTDGSTPTENSPVYDGTIQLNSGETTINAIAMAENMLPSEIATATFTINQVYNVTIDPNIQNGTVTADTLKGIEGDVVTLTATPSEGYFLKAWNVVDAEETPIEVTAGNTFNMPASDVTVSAQFDPDTFNVTVVVDPEAAGTVTSGAGRYAYGTDVNVEFETTPGYQLDYIGMAVEGEDEQESDDQFTMPAGDVTVTLHFLPATYSLTLEAGQGTLLNGFVRDNQYTFGQGFTLPTAADVEYTGHTFGGWYSNYNFTGDPMTEISTDAYGDTTVYAKWTPNDYTLTIHYQYSNESQAAPDYSAPVTYNTNYSVTSPTVEGYSPSQMVVSGVMPADNVEVTVTYSNDFFPLTIHYLYPDGTEAHADVVNNYAFQSEYEVASPTITNYMPDQVKVTGTMGSSPVEVTVTYTLVEMNAVEPVTICNDGTVSAISFSSSMNIGEMSYEWTSDTQLPINNTMTDEGEGNIEAFRVIIVGNDPVVATITVTPTCTYQDLAVTGVPQVFTITVNPSLTSEFSEVACDEYRWTEANTNIRVEGTHDYVYHFETAEGCDSVVTLHLTLYKTPVDVVADITANTSCDANQPNGVITVTAPVGTDYEYSLDEGNWQSGVEFSGLAAGTHNLSARHTGSECAKTVEVVVEDNVVVPEVTASTASTFYCLDGTITLTGSVNPAGDNYEYAWTGPNNFTANILNPAAMTATGAEQSGTYTLTVTNPTTNCTAEATVDVVVNVPATNGYVFNIIVSGDAYANINEGEDEANVVLAEPTVEHFLSDCNWTLVNNSNENTYNEVRDYTVTWTATDDCGNVATAEQIVHITADPCSTPVDGSNNSYPAVRLGGHCWMAANLRTTKYADGEDVPNIYKYQSNMYPDAEANAATYGYLYDWYDALRVDRPTRGAIVQGVCPAGWRLPNEDDFNALEAYDLYNLRSATGWLLPAGDNATGFNLLPAGQYNSDNVRYENLLGNAYLWSADAANEEMGRCHMADCNCYLWYEYPSSKNNAYSVRCVKSN